MSKVAIIDYDMGNVASVQKVLNFLGVQNTVTRKAKEIQEATHLILPGVGAYGAAMERLHAYDLVSPLSEYVLEKKIPILGICLGMQLMTETGTEYGNHRGLGWIAGTTTKLESGDLRLPHVGWNNITVTQRTLFDGITDDNFYFVHSYAVRPHDASIVSATCDYGKSFVAALQKDNIFATQFHPEKSQQSGIRVVKNFLTYA